jgi:hypothetical protein
VGQGCFCRLRIGRRGEGRSGKAGAGLEEELKWLSGKIMIEYARMLEGTAIFGGLSPGKLQVEEGMWDTDDQFQQK